MRQASQLGLIFATWGGVWLVGAISQSFGFAFADLVFGAAIALAALISVIIGLRMRPREGGQSHRVLLAGAVLGLALFGLVAILAPVDRLAATAAINFLIGAGLALAGIWRSAPVALTGLLLSVVVLVAWFGLREQAPLVFGLAGGTALLLSGYWIARR